MKILCVIILYRQNLYSCASYVSLLKNVLCDGVQLFIYDNSPHPMHYQNEFNTTFIHYVSNTLNPGVSVGYNEAAKYARKNNFDKLLLLDQDSYFNSASYVDDCIRLASIHPTIKLFVPLVVTTQNQSMSPRELICKIPISKSFTPNSIHSLSSVGIINSGMFVDVDAFFSVGGYNEDVFLDYSDYQFIDRFSAQYSQFYLLNNTIFQDFSNDKADKNQLLNRFMLFRRSISQYECRSIFDKCCIKLIVIKRCLSLTIRCRSMSFIKSLFYKFEFL